MDADADEQTAAWVDRAVGGISHGGVDRHERDRFARWAVVQPEAFLDVVRRARGIPLVGRLAATQCLMPLDGRVFEYRKQQNVAEALA